MASGGVPVTIATECVPVTDLHRPPVPESAVVSCWPGRARGVGGRPERLSWKEQIGAL